MAEHRLRALILGAGRGTRLRPLTDVLPKPMLPILGRPVVEQSLGALVAAGCEAVAINLHHLGGMIEGRLGGAFRGMRIVYSHEPELLGTLGALGPLRDFVDQAELFVVINGDSLCRWPLAALLRRHRLSAAAATLLLTARPNPDLFGGGVIVRRDSSIRSLRGGERGDKEHRVVFAGAHVFAPALLERAAIPLDGRAGDFVSDLYEPLLAAGERLMGLERRQHWHDLGTPERYLEGARNWGLGRWPRRLWRRNWVAPGAIIGREAQLSGSVVERDARVGAGSRVERSLILAGARIGPGSRLRSAIIGPDVALPEGSTIMRRMVTIARADVASSATDTMVGGLVYTRFEPQR
jgi:NDP-sugar pyrophosphorylase family protein